MRRRTERDSIHLLSNTLAPPAVRPPSAMSGLYTVLCLSACICNQSRGTKRKKNTPRIVHPHAFAEGPTRVRSGGFVKAQSRAPRCHALLPRQTGLLGDYTRRGARPSSVAHRTRTMRMWRVRYVPCLSGRAVSGGVSNLVGRYVPTVLASGEEWWRRRRAPSPRRSSEPPVFSFPSGCHHHPSP